MATKTIRVLLINYKFNNKHIKAGNLGTRLKNYYEKNSRGKLRIVLNTYTSTFNAKYVRHKLTPYINQTRNRVPKNHDYFVHFCNPPVSRANGKHAITFASSINTIHEFGHLLGLSHANHLQNGKLIRSKDPYDQMTSFASYPSTNAVHRFLKKWLLDTELAVIEDSDLEKGPIEFTICKLKAFGNKNNLKVIHYRTPAKGEGFEGVMKRFFISFADQKGADRLVVHTIYGQNSSILLNHFNITPNTIKTNKVYHNKQADLYFQVLERKGNIIRIQISSKTIEEKYLESIKDSDGNDIDIQTDLDTFELSSDNCICVCDLKKSSGQSFDDSPADD